ncbi:MAG: cyclomaltodextrinase / maltogenic alpha-amylase / neopullulanase [Verrucomicrobiota bacterium]
MRLCLVAFFLWLALPKLYPAETTVADPWPTEAIFYQIFPERFCNGDSHNNPTRESLETPIGPGPAWRLSSWTADWYARDGWEKELGNDFYRDGVLDRRYGGDLKGVVDKLDYLTDLGINAIYFNPLFYSRSLHKYDGNSYHHIDPYFGPDPMGDLAMIDRETSNPKSWQWTAADKLFLDLLKQCHKRHMHVIIDGVFNHTGRDFFAFKDIRQNQQSSRYKDWYVITSFDDPATKRNEFSYKGWYGHATLPIFAASADGRDMYPAAKDYIFEATKRWMQPRGKRSDGIDGWRLDVANERPAKFWTDWNAWVRKLNPSAYTTAEIWENAADFVKADGFSAAMNYNAFAIPVKGFLIDKNVLPSKFAELVDARRKQFPPVTAAVMQNLTDSHDTDRLASMIVNGEGTVYKDPNEIEFNVHNNAGVSQTYKIRKPNVRERNIQRLIVFLQMSYVGAPMIYYGDEAGMWGGGDPDDRMPMVWEGMACESQAIDPRGRERSPDEVRFDKDLFSFYKNAIALRREHDALNHGEFSVITADDVQNCLVLSRRSAKETLVIAINRSDNEAHLNLHVDSNQLLPIFVSRGEVDSVKAQQGTGGMEIILPALTGAVFSSN